VFVLHDVFRTPFEEIAETIGRPVATTRQLADEHVSRSKAEAQTPRIRRTSGSAR